MVEREVFLMKPSHQYHLSQRGEWICGAKSLKEKRLLCEFVFIPTDRQTLIPKNGGKCGFSYETKGSILLS